MTTASIGLPPSPLVVSGGVRVAILAGGGDLPLMIADSVLRQGGHVHVVAIEGAAGADVRRYPHTFVNFAQARRMFAALRGDGESRAQTLRNVMVIAGAVTRPDLMSLRPDIGLVPVLFDLVSFITAGGDDALLTKAIRLFERRGLTVVGVQDVAPELMIGAGCLGQHMPDAAAEFDLERAREVLDAIGDFDIGQGAVVEGGRVIAIEGVEGTDRMLERVATRGPLTRGVLLKAPKPRQERRVDLPTIGARTIVMAEAAGLKGLAVSAGLSIGLQRDEMVAAADRAGMFVTGVAVRAVPLVTANEPPLQTFQIDTLGLYMARLGDMADAEHGARAALRLARLHTGQAAAVVRSHVLGVSADEALAAFVQRQRRLAPWGLARFRRRRGAVVVRALAGDAAHDAADLARHAAAAGFAVLAFVVGERGPSEPFRAAIAAADSAGLALVSMRLNL